MLPMTVLPKRGKRLGGEAMREAAKKEGECLPQIMGKSWSETEIHEWSRS